MRNEMTKRDDSLRQRFGGGLVSLLRLVMLLGLYVVFAWAFLSSGAESPGLAHHVDATLLESGAKRRITAVLLNYRAYDTLLECFVLFLGVVTVWSIGHSCYDQHEPPVSSILVSLVRLLVPFMVLVAGYLLWAGHNQAGGAFQAGAILGGAGVLLLLTSSPLLFTLPHRLLSYGICLGPFFFLLIASATTGLGGYFLEYRWGVASMVIVALEAVTVFSIGLTLAGLFGGCRPE